MGLLARFLSGVEGPTRLLFTRAGPVENPRNVLYSYPGLPLSEAGRSASRRLAARLREESLALVVASDGFAEKEVASLLAGFLDVPLEIEPALRERSWGDWEGLTFAEVQNGWQESLDDWVNDEVGFTPPGGESLSDVERRSAPVIQRLLRRYAGSTLFLVGNCAVNRVLLKTALPFFSLDEGLRLEQNFAELSEVRFYGDDGVLIRLNERVMVESE